jgi:hypothetical protein
LEASRFPEWLEIALGRTRGRVRHLHRRYRERLRVRRHCGIWRQRMVEAVAAQFNHLLTKIE